jgi:hypothetical protein
LPLAASRPPLYECVFAYTAFLFAPVAVSTV